MGPQTVDENFHEVFIEFVTIFGPILIVYAVCIWLAGSLAIKRGRSRTRWTFRTVLFGPFALLVLAMLPSRRFEEPSSRPRRRRRH